VEGRNGLLGSGVPARVSPGHAPAPQGCRNLRAQMGRRVAGGWSYIDAQIERQVAEGLRLETVPECGTL